MTQFYDEDGLKNYEHVEFDFFGSMRAKDEDLTTSLAANFYRHPVNGYNLSN